LATDSMLVVLEDVVKEYKIGGQSVRALDGVNLEAGRGLMVAIVGPSGSGKSTLLNVLGAMDRPTSGRAVVEGVDLGRLGEKDLTEYRRAKVGFVFQAFNLIPNLSALENVMLPMEFAGVPADERKKRATELLERVGMSHRVGHTPARLSGGEQQRVAIARALANDPAIILADEPTGNLDSKTGREVIGLLRELARSRAKTVMVVTHDEAIEAVADRAVHIRDGRIAEKTALSRQGQDEDGRSNGRSSS
jgi:putative ABC transport system ATP-binding protein